jgi:hypothetical protein
LSSIRLALNARHFGFAISCSLLVCVSTLVAQNTAVSSDEVRAQARQLLDWAFTKCGDRYYRGVIDNSTCWNRPGGPGSRERPNVCRRYWEYDGLDPNPIAVPVPISRADQLNGLEWVGSITLTFEAEHTRDVFNGRWGPWGPWKAQGTWVLGTGPYVINFRKEKGVWTSDLRYTPGLVHMLTVDNEDLKGPLPCADLLNKDPHTEAPPTPPPPVQTSSSTGHLISDTYSQTMEKIKDNKSKGISDPYLSFLGPLSGFKVCSAIIDNKCQETGEVVRLPGDLAVPEGFWDSSSPNAFGACNRHGKRIPDPPSIVIKLTDQKDDKKRYLNCTQINILSARRQLLVETLRMSH